MEHSVEFITVEPRVIAAVRFEVDDAAEIGARMGAAFQEVATEMGRHGRTATGPAVALYVPRGAGFDVAAGFPLDGDDPPPTAGRVGPVTIPGGEVAITTHLGAYETVPEAYGALQAQAAAHGRALAETMWEEYWSDPTTPAEETRTVVCWPVLPA